MNRLVWLAIGVLAAAVIGLMLVLRADNQAERAAALTEDATKLASQATPGGEPARSVPASQVQVQLSYAPVVKRTAPAVVNIYTAQVVRSPMLNHPLFRNFGDQGGRVANSLGSGVIVDASGLIITNNHVVEGADEILVQLADRREFRARVEFAAPRTDLAVLRIDPGRHELPVLPLGDSDRVEVGDIVLAIGNPLGVGQTVTQGIVSATARTGVGISDYQFFLQTDAAINPGNSGGALVGMDGSLVGINTAIFSQSGGSEGVGFAIPSNMVKTILRAARTGKLERAYVGIAGEPVTPDVAAEAGLNRPAGVIVRQVSPNSPAADAGIRPGDVIFAVNGQEVSDPETLRYRVATQPVGSRATVTLIRNRKAQNVSVALEPPPERPARDLTRVGGNNLLTGVTVANLSPALAQELGGGLPEQGVVVVEVPRAAPAGQLRFLRPGDLIEAVNDERVDSVDELVTLASGAAEQMAVLINRGGQRAECIFQAPNRFFCRT